MAAWARETFTMAEPAMYNGAWAHCARTLPGAHASLACWFESLAVASASVAAASRRNNLSLGSSRGITKGDSTAKFAITRIACLPTRETRVLPRSAPETHRANHPPPLKPTQPARTLSKPPATVAGSGTVPFICRLSSENWRSLPLDVPPVNNSRRSEIVYVKSRSGRGA